jgi:hypothetical protein
VGLLGKGNERLRQAATVVKHLTAQQMSDRRKPGTARSRLKQRMAVDWVKLHQPEVWDEIVMWVDERGKQ